MREQAGGNALVDVTGDTVGAALNDLITKYPALKPKIFDKNDQVHHYMNVLVKNGDELDDVRYLDELDTKLTDGLVVVLLPGVSGG
jgi:sulfur-carrier protein